MSNEADRTAVTTSTMELIVAGCALVLGIVVAADSWRLGARWGSDGPQAGYFPFYIGLLLCAGSLSVIAATLRHRDVSAGFLSRAQFKRVLTLLLPLTVFVLLIKPLGLYVSSAVFVAYFMFRHGGHRLLTSLLVGFATGGVAFVAFELLLKIPLLKGPLEAALGFH